MTTRQALCPACGMILDVPAGKGDCNVRCGACHFRFRLPKITVTEDAIADWLGEGAPKPQDQPPPPPSPESTAVLPAINDPVRLVKADRKGALLEFACNRLTEQAFRCAMPRRCLRCGTINHLHARVIVFSTNQTASIGSEAPEMDESLSLKGDDVATLSEEELLQRLPQVPSLPFPLSMPMPFWLCDLCDARGLISAQARFTDQPGIGLCRLWIGMPRRADEFVVAAAGKNTAAHAALLKQLATMPEDPWDALPLKVQNHLRQWYHVQQGERFVAYVPEAQLARPQGGSEGLVVSSHRLIWHSRVLHREASVTERVEFVEDYDGRNHFLQIRAPGWQLKRLAVDREEIPRLRTALGKARFQAVWR